VLPRLRTPIITWLFLFDYLEKHKYILDYFKKTNWVVQIDLLHGIILQDNGIFKHNIMHLFFKIMAFKTGQILFWKPMNNLLMNEREREREREYIKEL
jgi:hypothetical protein